MLQATFSYFFKINVTNNNREVHIYFCTAITRVVNYNFGQKKRSFRRNGLTSNDCLPYEKNLKSCFEQLPFSTNPISFRNCYTKLIQAGTVFKSKKRLFYYVKTTLIAPKPLSALYYNSFYALWPTVF